MAKKNQFILIGVVSMLVWLIMVILSTHSFNVNIGMNPYWCLSTQFHQRTNELNEILSETVDHIPGPLHFK